LFFYESIGEKIVDRYGFERERKREREREKERGR
jgi:hypothetical protein